MSNIVLLSVLLLTGLVVALVFVPMLKARRIEKARAELAAFGLTPERYLATIPNNSYDNTVRREIAKNRLGIND